MVKGLKEIGTDKRQTELYEQWIFKGVECYFMIFSSCSEKRYSLICLENWYILRRSVMPKDGGYIG